MPQPTRSEVHVDAILTNISVAYMQSAENFIARRVFPTVSVAKQSDKYYTYDKNDWFRDEVQRRADGDPSAGSGYGLQTDTYSCDVWAFHKKIGPHTRANADTPINLDAEATRFVTQRFMQRHERQWVSDFFTTGIWDTDVVGGTDFTVWDDYGASDPIEDVETGKEAILSVTGYMPNTLVLGYQVFRQLKWHPDIRDVIKYTSDEVVSTDLLARLFGVDRVLVAQAVQATNEEGDTEAYSFTHGKHAWLGYVAPSPGLLEPSAGYTFVWSGLPGAAGLGADVVISSFYVDKEKSDYVEGESAWDNKVVATDMGYFFSAAVS